MQHDQWRQLPAQVRALPLDPRRALPIPFTTPVDPGTGQGDWGITSTEAVERCWHERLCGVCGKGLPAWVAFLGGPGSADRWRGAYSDPWMHEDCAEASLTACPYIARPKVPRISEPIKLALVIPPGEVAGKQDAWVMVICRRDLVTTTVQRTKTGLVRLFRPGEGNPRRERVFRYEGNRLVEQGQTT